MELKSEMHMPPHFWLSPGFLDKMRLICSAERTKNATLGFEVQWKGNSSTFIGL